jgi:hypothetical protein
MLVLLSPLLLLPRLALLLLLLWVQQQSRRQLLLLHCLPSQPQLQLAGSGCLHTAGQQAAERAERVPGLSTRRAEGRECEQASPAGADCQTMQQRAGTCLRGRKLFAVSFCLPLPTPQNVSLQAPHPPIIFLLLLAGTGAGRVCRQSGGSAQGRQAGRWAGKWQKQSYCKQLHREP